MAVHKVEAGQLVVLLILLAGSSPGRHIAVDPIPIRIQKLGVGLQLCVAVGAQGIEHVEIVLVHDEIPDRRGHAVFCLGLEDGLEIVVLQSCFEAGFEGHRLGMLPDDGDAFAGHGEGGGDVDQYGKSRRDPGQGGQRDAEAAPGTGPPGPGAGPVHRAIQGGRSLVQRLDQGPVFFFTAHAPTSSLLSWDRQISR